MENNDLRISVAVCTYRRFDLLGDCLELIKNQTLPSNQYEIIVVDNSLQPEQSAAFRDSLKGFNNLNYVITEKCGIAFARNVALEHCRAPILLFTDDDVRVPSNWCEEYVKAFEKYPGAGVIGGRVDPIWPSRPPAWLSGEMLNPLAVLNWDVKGVTPIGEFQWLVTANACYRVEALRKGGGFCERLGRKGKLPFWHAELGANLAIKSLGYDMLYAPHIKVGHMIEPQRMQKVWFFRQQLFGGASRVAVEWQKEEDIDFQVLAQELESNYTELIKKESANDTVEDMVRVTRFFNDEGYRICLKHLGLNPKQSPPPRSTSWPVIYVVTPCKNAASIIDQTIISVLSQAGDFCIRYHVQDGGSDDGTLKKLEEWKQRIDEGFFPLLCKNIVFSYSSGPDQGMYDGIVKGFARMSIPDMAYMTWINSDAFFFPFAFSQVMNTSRQSPDKVLWMGGQVSVMDEKRNSWLTPERLLPTEIVKHGLCDGKHWDLVQQEGIFFRKKLWDKALADGVFNGFRVAGYLRKIYKSFFKKFTRRSTIFHIPTMDDWFQLARRYNSYLKRNSLTLLKDFGSMRCISFIEDMFSDKGKDLRILEIGHGFSADVMRHFQAKHEVWGVDENQGLPYFDSDKWEENYQKCIVAWCPQVKLVRGLVGSTKCPAELPKNYFDVIYSISILEEVNANVLRSIIHGAAALLKPGGWLIGTHDLNQMMYGGMSNRIATYLDIHRECGLDLGEIPDPKGIRIDWELALIEHPAMVMLAYQMGTPEEQRVYHGHWTTMFTAAQKR